MRDASDGQARGRGCASSRWESSETAAATRAAARAQAAPRGLRRELVRRLQRARREDVPRCRGSGPQGARFVALHVDATDDDDPEVARVRNKYGVKEGLPVVLLFASDGHEAFRFTEFVPPDRLAGALAQVH